MEQVPQTANRASKKLLVTAIIVLVLVAIGVIVARWYRPSVVPPEAGGAPTVTHLPVTAVPNSFPSDIPIERGAKILDTYSATPADASRIQVTRVFESSKTVTENVALYKAFLSDSSRGWSIMSEAAGAAGSGQRFILAKKGDSLLDIGIYPRASGGSLVNLTVTMQTK